METSKKTDAVQVARIVELLEVLQCPSPKPGEGSSLFPQASDGTWPPTPDIVAGTFFGPLDPRSFFVDVVAPSGDYMFKDRAGAPATASFLTAVVNARGEFTMADLPTDFTKPLVSPVIKKSAKYAKGRNGSPLFGVAVYFDQLEKNGGALFSSLLYLRALAKEFGDVPFEVLERGHRTIPDDQHSFVATEVAWDLPLAFLLLVIVAGNDEPSSRIQVTLLANMHPRLDAVSTNPVVAWARQRPR